MAITEPNRHQLYTRLEQVLGTEEATVLMEHLPPMGWADVATKRDLTALESRFENLFSGLEVRVDARLSRQEAAFERSLRETQRNLFFGLLTAQTAFTGLLFALLR